MERAAYYNKMISLIVLGGVTTSLILGGVAAMAL